MIADEVYQGLNALQRDFFARSLEASTHIRIQNVANYYWEGSSQEVWELEEHFPNCAPPWNAMWMEWRQPQTVNSEGTILKSPIGGSPIGAFILGMKSKTEWPKWYLMITGFAPRLYPGASLGTAVVMVGPSGALWVPKVREVPHFRQMFKDVWGVLGPINETDQDPDAPAVLHMIPQIGNASLDDCMTFLTHSVRNPVLLALSFCNCRNVTATVTNLDQALVQSRAKKGKLPVDRYYTLQIEPMRRLIDQVEKDQAVSRQTALHIMRGHFKDYRKSGLFGKHKGIYWWDMALRGDAGQGTVKKDYSIKEVK